MTSRAALARHPLAIVGALIATASAVVFITLIIASIAGSFEHNPYAGLVVFIAIPALFVIGLALIPLGMWLERRRQRLRPDETADWPVIDFRRARVRQAALAITALTAANVVIILLAGYGSLHWMESPQFCGQACHTPMHPQFTAWSNATHARIACVDCHVGEGAAGFVRAKASGVRQLVHVVTNRVPKPIPPGAELPSGFQAAMCGRCHRPDRTGGDVIRTIREFADDETNTETTTTLVLHVEKSKSSARAIHWHADPAVRVEYVATDEARQTIPYVKVTDANGQVKEFRAEGATDHAVSGGSRHTIDCVDCHNVVGHPIAPTPEKAADRAIAAMAVSQRLPFARREGLRVIKDSYPTEDVALIAIDRELRTFYASRPGAADAAVNQTVASFQNAYRQNVFPSMKVAFGSYPDNKGHTTSNGCVRCHDDSHVAKDGAKISGDCEYCHKQLEQPF